jgi:hypothetical protein
MSILTHHITRREAPAVAKALKAADYNVTAEECYAFVSNLADSLEPMDRAARAQIVEVIENAVAAFRH